MKAMFAVWMVILTMFLGRTAFAEAKTGAKHYFEPTVAEWNCCAKEIRAQQADYIASRDAKDYSGARKNAIWHFQIAWQFNNEANAMLSDKVGWGSVEMIKEALALLDSAEAALGKDAKLKEHADDKRAIHARDIVKCQEKIDANRKAALDQIKELEKDSK